MIGSEKQNVKICFTTLPAYACRLRPLNEIALPIVRRGTTLSARGFKFQVLHSLYDTVAAIIFEAPAAAVRRLAARNRTSAAARSAKLSLARC